MKIGEKKLTKGAGLKGSGGSGGAYTSRGSFLKSIAKKFGLGKRTSPQEKAAKAWELSLPKKRAGKGLKKTKEYEGERLPKKEMQKIQEQQESKFQVEKARAAKAEAQKKEDATYSRDIFGKVVGKASRKVMAPAALYSLYEMAKRKKAKRKK